MKKIKIESACLISKFKYHGEIKDELLNYIAKQESKPSERKDGQERISNTDWYVKQLKQREYWDFISPYLEDHMRGVCDELKILPNDRQIGNFWFIQYEKNDYRTWHRHCGTTWTNIYYVELPEPKMSTLLMSDYDGRIIQPEVEEGDIITFSSNILHCSPIVETNSRKTVLSFNIK